LPFAPNFADVETNTKMLPTWSRYFICLETVHAADNHKTISKSLYTYSSVHCSYYDSGGYLFCHKGSWKNQRKHKFFPHWK